jgi:hypothetical protein
VGVSQGLALSSASAASAAAEERWRGAWRAVFEER